MPRVLLHVCCAPCATHCVQRLRAVRAVTLFFSNSNIDSADEFDRRLAAARRLAAEEALPLVEDPYDHGAWQRAVAGLEGEPEGGARCRACFAFSLGRAAAYAAAHGFDAYTTTLTVSPHKASPVIFDVGGRQAAPFLAEDFKKGDGFRRSVALSRALGLYRQDYCGCEHARRRPAARSGEG